MVGCVYSYVRLLACALVPNMRMLVRALVWLFVRLCDCPRAGLFVCNFVCWMVDAFMCLFVWRLIV